MAAPVEALPPQAHVVQIACGTGGLSRALARRRPDLKVTGIDLDPGVLAQARAEAEPGGPTVDFRVMDMTRLELPDATVDAVISRMGLLSPGTPAYDVSAREAARIL